MTTHLTLETLLRIAERALADQQVQVRDYGLLESAIARPAATVFGEDAYPTLEVKAAALLHSLGTNHTLVDGNERLAWAATIVFLMLNGRVIANPPGPDAFDLVVAIASGQESDLTKIGERLLAWSVPA